MIRKSLASIALAVATLAGGTAASAAPWAPSYGPGPVVAYGYGAQPSIGEYHVQGRVVQFDHFYMGVRVDGRFVRVHLHQGTVINPTGLTLQPGMFVHVDGHWINDTLFHADQINLLN